jgi:hypothetical protein
MPSAEPAADGYVLALEEARRALDEQERAVAELRARAGTLISAATIATSFLGAPLVAGDHLGPASAVAVGAFVLQSLATLTLLWSRWEFEFALNPALIIARYVEPIAGKPAPLLRLRRELALHMDAGAELNRTSIARMTTIFRTSCVLLTTEIVAWVVAILFGA